MAGNLYDELEALDHGVAEAYVLNAYAPELSVFSAKRIVDRVTGDGSLTTNESKALLHLLKNGKFEENARETMANKIADKLYEGVIGKKPLTGAGLEPIRRALTIPNVAMIQFVSPLTAVPYTPEHYLSILKLIEKGSIKVFEVDLGKWPEAIDTTYGFYEIKTNQLILAKGFSWEQQLNTIVHEVTHAIQDWLNKVAVSQYLEADAYLAAAVIDYKFKVQPGIYPTGTPERVALDAVNKLLDANQKLAGRPLSNALNAISTAFVQDPTTGKNANQKPRVEAGATEAGEMLKELAAVREFFKLFSKGLKKAFDSLPSKTR